MDTTELPTFDVDAGIFAEVAGTIDPLSPDVATHGRDSQGGDPAAIDVAVSDATESAEAAP